MLPRRVTFSEELTVHNVPADCESHNGREWWMKHDLRRNVTPVEFNKPEQELNERLE